MAITEIYKEKKHPLYFSTTRTEIFPLLPDMFTTILELGCGNGSTLAALKSKNPSLKTVGIDINNENLNHLHKMGIDDVLIGNIETIEMPYPPESFDVILCLDVLEHLADPWSTIDRLAPLLKTNGTLIASIPNVQNIRALVPLVFGRWDYTDCGILDKGHLRFFTKRSAIQLINRSGLKVSKTLEITEPHWLPRIANALTLNFLKRLVTVQFLISATKGQA